MTSKESLTLLIDGDILLYQICSANEQETRWPGNRWTLHSDGDTCQRQVDQAILDLQETLEADRSIVCLSDPSGHYFRHDLYDGYKCKRDGRKPLAYAAVRDYVESTYPSRCFPNLEADDVMGFLQTEDTIIVSEDKDMLTIPGWVYRREALVRVDEDEADYNWLTQTLTGDQVDGYPGCPKVGPKTAPKILMGMGDPWSNVVHAYRKVGLTEDDAITQARLARILRKGEYNLKTGQVKLWSPEVTA